MLKNILENQNLNVLGLYDILRRQKQLSTITATGFPVLRNGYLPQKDISNNTDYILLKDLSHVQFANSSDQIFETVINYLRLLALRGFYIKGSLLDQIIISKTDTMIIQLYPYYITRQQQKIQQIIELAEFLQLNKKIDARITLGIFLFPQGDGLKTQPALNDIVCQLTTMEDLVNDFNISKVVIDNFQIVPLDQLLKYLHDSNYFENVDLKSNSQQTAVFWSLMSRYCLERKAVRQLQYLPNQLIEFISLNSQLEKPHYLQTYTSLPWRDMLRMVVGLYPENLELYFKSGDHIDQNVNNSFIDVAERLPEWYTGKFKQLLLCAHNIQSSSEQTFDLFNLKSPLDPDSIKKLCDYYL